MIKPNTQILLVSESLPAQLKAIVDTQMATSRVILCSDGSDNNEHLIRLFKQHCAPKGIDVEVSHLPGHTDTAQIRSYFKALIAQYPDSVLNCRSGIEPYGILSHEAYFGASLPAYYIDGDWLRWLNNPDGYSDFDLSETLSIEDALGVRGLRVTKINRDPIDPSRMAVAHKWAGNFKQYHKQISSLNYYASKAERSLTATINDTDLQRMHDVLNDLQSLQLAQLKGNQITFVSEEDRFFAAGGWLEEHLFGELTNAQSSNNKLTDVARSVTIEWAETPSQPVKNEFDGVALFDNQIMIYECKTRNFKSTSATPTLYKLAALVSEIGGDDSRGTLVSYYHLKPFDLQRAKVMQLDVM